MLPAREILSQNGINLRQYSTGEHTCVCPRCSSHRNKKRLECLDVAITKDGRAYWKCHHCNWTGPDKGSLDDSPLRQGTDRLTYHVYRDLTANEVRRKVRNVKGREPKCWWERREESGEWVKGKGDANKQLLYRIDEVQAAIKQGLEIAITEGEKDVDRLWSIGIPATCSPDGASTDDKRSKWLKAHSEQIAGAKVCVFQDHDAPGRAHADETVKQCLKVGCAVTRVDLHNYWKEIPEGGDVSDLLDAGHSPDLVREAIAAAQVIGKTAKPVKAEKAPAEPKSKFPTYEPWPEPVAIAQLLDTIVTAFIRCVIAPPGAAEKVALWSLHTWVYQAGLHSPRLDVFSPEAGCGKSRLMMLLNRMVQRPKLMTNATAAWVFRYTAEQHATLLLDEGENWLYDREDEIPNVINSGFEVGGCVGRCSPNTHAPEDFDVYGPMALGHVGHWPMPRYRTTVSRMITVRMDRLAANQKVEMVPAADAFSELNRKLTRFRQDSLELLKKADPQLPGIGRAADKWRLMCAIADLAGDDWSHRARGLIDAKQDQQGRFTDLLGHVRDIFLNRATGFVSTDTMVSDLLANHDVYKEWSRGKEITKAALARALDDYDIHPTKHGHNNERGYLLAHCEKSFASYLQPIAPLPPLQTAGPLADSQNQPLSASALVKNEPPCERSQFPKPNSRRSLEDELSDWDDL